MATLVYYHGLASSPGSTKARLLREAMAGGPHTVVVPNLNQPSFEQLTVTAMLAHALDTLPDDAPLYLLGSSLGGFIAAHVAARVPERITGMLLLAPSFDIAANRDRQMGADGVAAWQATGYWETHNYAQGGPAHLHYGFYEDARGYNANTLTFDTPTHIIHGRQDEVVPVDDSIAFAQARDNVTLTVVEDDHRLVDSFTTILTTAQAQFGV